MARGLTDDSNYQAIADAIRAKNGGTDTYFPEEMAQAVLDIETGAALAPLDNPATAAKILKGYEAYNDDGETIVGEALPALSNPATAQKILSGYQAYTADGEAITGEALPPLSNPATGQQILSGFEAYDANGNPLSGTAFLTGGTAEFTLEAANWNGTTYTVVTNDWRAVDGQTPLMDLPFTSSAVNAQRVVEAGITMPSVTTTSSTNSETGVVTYTTTIIFSAVRTPPVDVDVAVFNITEVAAAASTGEEETA